MSTDGSSFDSFDFDDVDPDKVGSGSILPEGGYRAVVTSVTVQNDNGSTTVECEIKCAKEPRYVGKKHFEFLRWPKPDGSEVGNRIAKEQLLAWCFATKTTTPAEIKQRQQARQGFNPAWLEAMVGRDVLIFLKHEEYKGKISAKADGKVWAVDNLRGKNIPGFEGQVAPAAGAPVTPPPVAPQNEFDGMV